MEKKLLRDGDATFEVTAFESERPTRLVLFAVGGGGDPGRHEPLLAALAARGFSVVAPHFERMTSPHPSEAMLIARSRRLQLALDFAAGSGAPVVGVGHSIGAAVLLALAGAQLWLGPARPLDIQVDERLTKLALLAPATGFFRAPDALRAVRIPLVVWAGSADTVTPPDEALLLRDAVSPQALADVHVVEGADHFSFMHVLPPGRTDTRFPREAFLETLTELIGSAVGS